MCERETVTETETQRQRQIDRVTERGTDRDRDFKITIMLYCLGKERAEGGEE